MKQFILLVIFLFVISCKKADAPADESFVYFEKPQPIYDAELSKIPNKFRGLFINSDSVYLNISENMISKEFTRKFRIHKTEIDSLKKEFDFVNGKYVSKGYKVVFDFIKIGDSLELSNKEIDTIFIFSNTQKAKRFNGKLILNYSDSIYWTVNTIDLEKNLLHLKSIGSKEDLKKIDSLTHLKSVQIDSFRFVVKPSRNEFKTFINLKRFHVDEAFKKI
ncbi:hypothetical protein [Flavobacterium sp. FPG59]|uniref:hypothetical protein n=1 Tax=Flavobacterium sp. FPG59 TaxID=1929267 RepID=UPI000A397A43|nr:hypothetical protein [Flavobacterium sp. FPG59]OUD37047.1 hypothetical protein FPG59_03320 [Flavobacterium sp. FPG59]